MNNNLAFLKRLLLVGKLYPESEKIVSMCLFPKYCEFYKNMKNVMLIFHIWQMNLSDLLMSMKTLGFQ